MGVGFVLMMLRKFYPLKELTSTEAAEIAALGKIFSRWQKISAAFIFVYLMACGFVWFLLLCFLGRMAARSHGPSPFVLVPGPIFWFLPTLFLTMISAAVPTHFTMKAILGSSHEDYTTWSNLQAGFDGWKASRLLALLIACISGLLVAVGLSTWVVFRDDRFEVKRPWAWNASIYPYRRVKAIAHVKRLKAPIGTINDNPHYAIRFDDGWTWTSEQNIDIPDMKRDEKIIALVSNRSGRPIQQLDLIDDMKP